VVDPDMVIESGDSRYLTFSNVHWGSIWGYKFYDKDLDGVMDDGEPGMGGWVIVLEGLRDDGTPIYDTYTTDGDGYFEFLTVQPGIYTVDEIMWPDWQTTSNLPVDVEVSGVLDEWTLYLEIGNIQFAKIWGYKFLDTYADCYPFWPNGIFDLPDEHGLGNWEITLDGYTTEGVHVHEVVYTENIDMGMIGYYEFDGLLPGTYTVTETLLTGYWATTQLSATIIIYPFPYGPVSKRLDFGNLVPSADPEVNFVLQAGWNMWSTPIIVEGLTASSLLQNVGQSGVLVMKIDKASNSLLTYVAGDDPMFDFPIVVGEGYYLWVSGETVFQLEGFMPGPRTESLTDGWNFIGHDGLRPLTASKLLAKVQGAQALLVMGYNPHTGNLDTFVVGDDPMYDFEVTPGRAYFIWVSGAGTITY
jgi:hypothetical protein